MKILIFEPTGGFWPYAPNFAKAIKNYDQNNEVMLLTSSSRKSDNINNVMLRAECKSMNQEIKRNNKIAWLIDRVYSSLQWLIIRHKLIKEFKPDILHIQYTPTIFDQFLLPWLRKRIKVIITVHDVIPLIQTKIHTLKSLKKVYRSADEIIIHSRNNKNELIEFMGYECNNMHIIPHIMDSIPSTKNLPSEEESKEYLKLISNKQYLLFFGGIRKSKGLDLAIKAMYYLKDISEDAILLIAGSLHWDVNIKDIEALIKQYELEDRVALHLGYINESEVDYYFCASKLVLLPYIKFHSQSGVLLQSYQYQKPVIASNQGSLGETILEDETGLIIDALEPSILAKKIGALLKEKILYDTCATNQLNAINKKYNSFNIADLTVSVYRL